MGRSIGGRLISGVAVAVSALALAACGGGEKVDAEHPTTVALVFVDISKSTYGPAGQQRARYVAAFRRIVDPRVLPGGTRLLADLISADPLSESSLPIDQFYEKYQGITGKKNKFQIDQQHRVAEESAIRDFTTLSTRKSVGDSILDSLDIAQQVFDSLPSATTRYLVIFSDMIETSARIRFTVRNLQPEKVDAFISQEQQAGRLPNLKGVDVYVAGAGVTRGADAHPALTRLVRQFWLRYFTATQATLLPAHYGPVLISFP